MSPEQARGEETRSPQRHLLLGGVLYQLTTGKLPFPGTTSAVVFDNILHSVPGSRHSLNTNAPPELERILNKALEKDPSDVRYQVAAELRADLNACCANWTPAKPLPLPLLRLASQRKCPCRPSLPSQRVRPQVVQCLSPPPAEQDRRRVAFLVVILLVAARPSVFIPYAAQKTLPVESMSVEISPITVTFFLARISPDGNTCSTSWRRNGLQSLWLRHIPTGSNTQVVRPRPRATAASPFLPMALHLLRPPRDSEQSIASLYDAPIAWWELRVCLSRTWTAPSPFLPTASDLPICTNTAIPP